MFSEVVGKFGECDIWEVKGRLCFKEEVINCIRCYWVVREGKNREMYVRVIGDFGKYI